MESTQQTEGNPKKSIDQVLSAMACPINTRVPPIEPGKESPEVKELYDLCHDMYGIVPKFIQVLAHAPGAARSFLIFDRDIKVAALQAGDKERSRMQVLCILKPSLDNSCHNCAHHNVALARQLEFTDEQLLSISSNSWHQNNDFTEKEKIVLDWANAVTDMSARDKNSLFQKMLEHFSNSELVELTYTTALWNCTNRLAEAMHITAESSDKGINWDKK